MLQPLMLRLTRKAATFAAARPTLIFNRGLRQNEVDTVALTVRPLLYALHKALVSMGKNVHLLNSGTKQAVHCCF